MRTNEFRYKAQEIHVSVIRSVESRLLSGYIDAGRGPFLDLGCGNGNFCRTLGLKDVYGVDIDERSVNWAVKSGCYKEALVASASKTPFEDAFFGTVFSNCAIEHMDSMETVIREVYRVLKDRGEFILTVPVPRFMDVLRGDEDLSRIGLNDTAVITRYNEIHHHVNILGYEEWESLFARCGFTVDRYEHYLPDVIGAFVVRMDMLYTVEAPDSKILLKKLEADYWSTAGDELRGSIERYMANPHGAETGTHLIIKAIKAGVQG